jgi:hypothetical protein
VPPPLEIEIAGIELRDTLERIDVEQRDAAMLELNEALAPELLERPVHMNRGQAEALA